MLTKITHRGVRTGLEYSATTILLLKPRLNTLGHLITETDMLWCTTVQYKGLNSTLLP